MIIFRKWIGKIAIGLEFEPGDLWLGVFWKSELVEHGFRGTSLYICIIPMLPIRLIIHTRGQSAEYWRK